MSEAGMVIQTVMQDEIGNLALIVLLALGLGCWFGYVLREWSWVPRKDARKGYGQLGMRNSELPSSDPLARATFPHRWGKAFGRRGKAFGDAPAPADLGYDPMNPMNGGRRRETVEICGATWYLMK